MNDIVLCIVHREQGNKRILNDKVREFALMCRGFHGTVYAVETAQQTWEIME